MTWTRRDVLASFGVASGSAILFACGAPVRQPMRPTAVNPELRTWLRDAVAMLHAAGLSAPHALAVSRKRTTAAIDVLGDGVARSRSDGLVLSIRDKDGMQREQVTNDLSRDGILAAARALAGKGAKRGSVDFGPLPPPPTVEGPDPDTLGDGEMLARAGSLAQRDRGQSSRIVYAAAVIDIDDAHVWSIAPGRMLEQRLVRVRRSITRVAWHGSRPVVSEAMRAWSSGVDAQDLSDAEIVTARENALALPTPMPFEDKEYDVVLEPALVASILDAGLGAVLALESLAPVLTIADEPGTPNAYGAFAFDDRGEVARGQPLVTGGKVAGQLARGRRPGHVGLVETTISHLAIAPGTAEADDLLDDGLILEGPISTLVDPQTGRVVVEVARARQRAAKRRTGRVFVDIELVTTLPALLGNITGVSKQTRSIGMRDEVDGQPRWRSIESPWLRGRALLRQHRRTT